MEDKNTYIGVDLGGTNLRCGTVNYGKLVDLVSTPLLEKDNEQSVLNQITSLISKQFSSKVEAIGIGVPSVVDPVNGIVYDTANIPSWKEVHLKEELENVFQVPVSVNNDANCFVLGEKYFGQAIGHQNVVGLTLGTGVGAGLILNEQLYYGNNCGAGEYGMSPFLDSDFEHYCSAMFFEQKHNTHALDTYHAAIKGDKKALSLFNEMGTNMSYLLKNVLYTLDPQLIILGGSISKAYAYFSDAMHQGLTDFGFPKSLEKVKVVVSELENAGVLGAAMLHKEYQLSQLTQ